MKAKKSLFKVDSESILVSFNNALVKSAKFRLERRIARASIDESRKARQHDKGRPFYSFICFHYSIRVMQICLAGGDSEDDIDASDSESDMENTYADENADMQELCDELCSEYLPDCGLGSDTGYESD
jgi:hypothetical protein